MKDKNKPKYNIHAAVSEKCCREMAKNNGWKLVQVQDNGTKVLSKDCIFKGEQTSFQSQE